MNLDAGESFTCEPCVLPGSRGLVTEPEEDVCKKDEIVLELQPIAAEEEPPVKESVVGCSPFS